MTKNLKLNIKNKQIAGAINLSGLKDKLAKKKPDEDTHSTSQEETMGDLTKDAAKKKKKVVSDKETLAKAKKPLKKIQDKENIQPLEVDNSVFSQEATSQSRVLEKETIKEVAVHKEKLQTQEEKVVIEEKIILSPKVEPKAHQKELEPQKKQENHLKLGPIMQPQTRPTQVKPEVRYETKPDVRSAPREHHQQGGRPYQQRPAYDRQGQDRQGQDRQWQDRPSQDRPSQDRQGQDRRFQQRPGQERYHGQDRSFQQRPGQYQQRPGQDRSQGQERPGQDRSQGQERQWQDRPPGQDRYGQNRPFQQRPAGDRNQYARSDSRPDTRSDGRSDTRPAGDRQQQFRGSGAPYQRGPVAPFQRGPGGAPFQRGPSGAPYQRRPMDRPPYSSSNAGTRPATRPFTGDGKDARRGPVPPPFEDMKGGRREFKPENSRFKSSKQRDEESTKVVKRGEEKVFDARARHGVFEDDEGGTWRKRKQKTIQINQVQEIVRPSKIKVRLPITVKDLAAEMKFKASELISKFFVQGIVVTLNDILSDAIIVQLMGQEFGCEIVIDTKEEERIRISDKNVKQEILEEGSGNLEKRPPITAFMGHVDHGKTSLVDAIRKTNLAAKEVGAITQHIGAFKCKTQHGDITILDTPGHEAFTLMRERGAGVTDIVVLVVAGDEGVKEQTIEAIKQAKAANATIVVAMTKADKPNFSQDLVFRQLTDHELLPEAWGGSTVTVQCSALKGDGIQELLEMLALQADVLELKANPQRRARGTVIESEMQQGLGATTTLLVQNGTLNMGDAVVFGSEWAKVKSMKDEYGKDIDRAIPSTPVRITGLSGLPDAGEEFIVVKSDKEAREIAESRREGRRQSGFQLKKRLSMESLIETQKNVKKKILTLILRADVQGSLEALTKALEKIKSDKATTNIISHGVGQISESDVQLAAASDATILGFHTGIESHADPLIKQLGAKVILHEIIYHAVDNVKDLMKGLLDKLEEEEDKGKVEVRALFKASQLGTIAGCMVIDGTITRSSRIRLRRANEIIFKGPISSLKRFKEDVKEVSKGMECGILLQGFTDIQVGDVLEAYEIKYITQEL